MFPGENPGRIDQLAALDRLIEKKRWPEAVDECIRLLTDGADDVVRINERQTISLRHACHRRIAAFPREALARYRNRVDDLARALREEARNDRDLAPLGRLVDEFFCSSYGDRALDMLGNRAFDRGEFDEAVCWWNHLAVPLEDGAVGSPARTAELASLVFPDPRPHIAQTRAKRLISVLFAGDIARFDRGLERFQAQHGRAEGLLADVRGPLAEILGQLRRRPEELIRPPVNPPYGTFAGHPSRQFRANRAPSSALFAAQPWRASLGSLLPEFQRDRYGAVETQAAAATRLVFFPAIVGRQVFVAGPYEVVGFDLATGTKTGAFGLAEPARAPPMEGPTPLSDLPRTRYTVTADGDRLYVRLGAPARGRRLEAPALQPAAAGESFLFCLDTRTWPAGAFSPRWQVPAASQPGSMSFFEGSPAVRDGRVYIARTAFGGIMVTTYIECYRAETGELLWRRRVCDHQELKGTLPRAHDRLVTLAGPEVVFCNHAGAVVALDAVTGRWSWAVRYPSRAPSTGPPAFGHDLSPCVFAGGLIFASPADYDRVICMTPGTGAIRWESGPVAVEQILGLAGDRLFLTTSSFPRGIRALDALTGRAVRSSIHPDDGLSELPTMGRGLLAGEKIFWPTAAGVRCLGQRDAQVDLAESYYLAHRLAGSVGNLAFGSGCLAIAGADTLEVYGPRRAAR